MSMPQWSGNEDRWTRSERWQTNAAAYRELDDDPFNERRRREVSGLGQRVAVVLVCLVGAPVARAVGRATHRTAAGWEFLYFLGFCAVMVGLGFLIRAVRDRIWL